MLPEVFYNYFRTKVRKYENTFESTFESTFVPSYSTEYNVVGGLSALYKCTFVLSYEKYFRTKVLPYVYLYTYVSRTERTKYEDKYLFPEIQLRTYESTFESTFVATSGSTFKVEHCM